MGVISEESKSSPLVSLKEPLMSTEYVSMDEKMHIVHSRTQLNSKTFKVMGFFAFAVVVVIVVLAVMSSSGG